MPILAAEMARLGSHACRVCVCVRVRVHVRGAVGNKIDKANREVSRAEGIDFARNRGMLFIECSAKAKTGIQQVHKTQLPI